MTLKASDTKSLWQLSNELLRTDTMGGLIDTLFDGGRNLFPFDSAVFFPLDSVLFKPIDTGHLGRSIDANKLASEYSERYYKVDPLKVVEKPCNHNLAMRTHDVISEKSYRGSEIWQDFYRPVGIDKVMGMCVVSGDGPVCGIGLHREKNAKAFSRADKDRMTLLAPSIAQGIARIRLLDRTERLVLNGSSGAGSEVAVWLLDSPAKIRNSNALAEQIASSWGRAYRRQAKLLFPKPIQTLIEGLNRPGYTSLYTGMTEPRAESMSYMVGEQWYVFTATTASPGAMPGGAGSILVTATKRSERLGFDEAAQGLGLSMREKEIARMVMRGQSNKEIAGCLRIVEQTVKDHLRSVFAKAGVKSRARLIAKLLNSL